MEDFLYAYNQPKKFGKYDLILDGKIIANEVVYKVLTEDNEIENINLVDKVKELESKLQTHFTFETVTELPTEGKETVIYLVANDEESGDKDSYNEYMWVKEKGEFELIGSGTYAQQQADLDAEVKRATEKENELSDAITNETKRATEKEASIDAELAKRVPYTLHKSVDVVGNIKDVVKLDVPESSKEAMYCPQGLIMGGSALDAGLVTRGICGVSNPADDGYCVKENLYINYDGTNTYYDPYRQVIIQAGVSGEHYGHNLYQYAAARGDAVKGYVDEKIENRVVINEPITITEGDNTTSITSDTISTTTLTGTLDAESMKNSLTAEAIQNAAPIAWGNYSAVFGVSAKSKKNYSVALGYGVDSQSDLSITIGSKVYSGNSTFDCITEAPQSITIGAGANTLNTTKTVDGVETTVESSNAITIGCKANNSGADSVVIGAAAQGKFSGSVTIGGGARGGAASPTVAIGTNAVAGGADVAIGYEASASYGHSVGLGYYAKSSGGKSVCIGASSKITTAAAADGTVTYPDNTTVIGYGTKASAPLSLTFGSSFSDTEDSYNCSTEGTGSITIGAGANTLNTTITDSEGNETTVDSSNSITIGCKAENKSADNVVIGAQATANIHGGNVIIGAKAGNNGANEGNLANGCVVIGKGATSSYSQTVAVGSQSKSGLNSVALGFSASALPDKTITIGAGANITNTTAEDGTVTKSENTTVIGSGATASAPNAVVLGAGASTAGAGTILIGAGTNLAAGSGNITNAILIGTGAKSAGEWAGGSIALGANSTVLGDAAYAIGGGSESSTGGIAIGTGAKAGYYGNAIGISCVNRNNGTTSFRQQRSNGETYTQFYIMAAESDLAVQYEDGEACMGYVVKNKTTGELVAAGTQKLSVLFPNNSTFQPATIDENGEWAMPKVFHPSDLDLPIEEPSENNDVEINIPTIEEEYNPLPIYPIVETPIEEEYKPLPIYPIVEPTIDEITE